MWMISVEMGQLSNENASEQLKPAKHLNCWSSCNSWKSRIILLRMMRCGNQDDSIPLTLLQEAHITYLSSITKIPWKSSHCGARGGKGKDRVEKKPKKKTRQNPPTPFWIEFACGNLILWVRFHSLNVKDFVELVIEKSKTLFLRLDKKLLYSS